MQSVLKSLFPYLPVLLCYRFIHFMAESIKTTTLNNKMNKGDQLVHQKCIYKLHYCAKIQQKLTFPLFSNAMPTNLNQNANTMQNYVYAGRISINRIKLNILKPNTFVYTILITHVKCIMEI